MRLKQMQKAVSYHWQKVRQECIKRDKGVCRKCTIETNEVHHIIPKSKGGTFFELENLILLCKKHHAIADNTYFKFRLTSMARIWLKENRNIYKE